jgi:hypothetical protein
MAAADQRFLSEDLILSCVPDCRTSRYVAGVTRTKISFGDQRKRLQLQVEALLEEMMVNLSSVVSDLFG